MKKILFFVLLVFALLLQPSWSFALGETGTLRKFFLEYLVEVKDIPAGSKQLDLWIPLPTNDEDQNILDVSVVSPYPLSLHYDPEWGNGMLAATVKNPKPFQIRIAYVVERKERRIVGMDYESPAATGELSESFQTYLRPAKFSEVNDSVKKYAASAAQGKKNALAQARGIYDFVHSKLEYNKTIPGWGRGDVSRLCFVLDSGKNGTGNCTDFHSLFAAMMQAQGIPVKFEMGYPLTPGADQGELKAGGYHCWAKFFIPGYGWIPVDISEANKAPEKKEYFWGGICENRIRFSTGRDILLSPPQKGERLNFFGPDPYMEADGKPFSGFVRSIAYRDIKN